MQFEALLALLLAAAGKRAPQAPPPVAPVIALRDATRFCALAATRQSAPSTSYGNFYTFGPADKPLRSMAKAPAEVKRFAQTLPWAPRENIGPYVSFPSTKGTAWAFPAVTMTACEVAWFGPPEEVEAAVAAALLVEEGWSSMAGTPSPPPPGEHILLKRLSAPGAHRWVLRLWIRPTPALPEGGGPEARLSLLAAADDAPPKP